LGDWTYVRGRKELGIEREMRGVLEIVLYIKIYSEVEVY
jgi:hypothetical protein